MEIILKRIARKDAYTIGHLYILKDGEVTRKVNCAMMASEALVHKHLRPRVAERGVLFL